MWQDYLNLCKMHWPFTLHHGWKLLIIVLFVWLIVWIIYKIKD